MLIKPQSALSALFIRAMADVTIVRENGLDFGREINFGKDSGSEAEEDDEWAHASRGIRWMSKISKPENPDG